MYRDSLQEAGEVDLLPGNFALLETMSIWKAIPNAEAALFADAAQVGNTAISDAEAVARVGRLSNRASLRPYVLDGVRSANRATGSGESLQYVRNREVFVRVDDVGLRVGEFQIVVLFSATPRIPSEPGISVVRHLLAQASIASLSDSGNDDADQCCGRRLRTGSTRCPKSTTSRPPG